MRLGISTPATNVRGPQYMEQVLSALHQGCPQGTCITLGIERGESGALSLHCDATCALRTLVESQFYAQYPDCRIEPIADEELSAGTAVWQGFLTISRDIFPLKRFPQFDDPQNRATSDPLTGILAALASGPLNASVELILRPATHRRQRIAHAALHRLATPYFRSRPIRAHLYAAWRLSPRRFLRVLGILIGRAARGKHVLQPDAAIRLSSTRQHDREDDLQAAADKLGRQLFEAELQITVVGPRRLAPEARNRIHEIAAAFGQFSVPRLASLRCSRTHRLAGLSARIRGRSMLLSTEEVATLWHPPTATVRSPTLPGVVSREREPPLELPTPDKHASLAILGETTFRGVRQRFGILPDDRRRHLVLLGKTGMGKSTLLQNLFASDVAASRGAMLLDPHGDLAEAVLRTIPRKRTNDVIVFDAGDMAHPFAFNVLSCANPSLRPLLASGIVSAFKKLFAHSWGPRLEHILRHSLLALTEVPGTSLLSIARLLSDRHYRQGIVARVEDPVVRHFWEREFAALPLRLQIESVAPIQNKVGQFIASPILRNILGQSKATLDLRRVMDERRVLIVNLSKGRVGEDASSLLGSLLVTTVQLAAMTRADSAEDARPDFSLFVDEFQNVATESFSTILSEARKYRVNLTLANQYLEQIEEPTLAAIFGNVGTVVAFQIGARDAEVVATQLAGDIVPADLLALPRYQAYVRLLIDGQPSRPFSMRTLPPALRAEDRRLNTIRRLSQRRHSRSRADVEAEIAAALAR